MELVLPFLRKPGQLKRLTESRVRRVAGSCIPGPAAGAGRGAPRASATALEMNPSWVALEPGICVRRPWL